MEVKEQESSWWRVAQVKLKNKELGSENLSDLEHWKSDEDFFFL